jgi:DNA-binding XRE family transcriptional regulator
MAKRPLLNQGYRNEVSRRLRSFRAKHLMRQEDLAKALGVCRNTINSYEQGTSSPQLRTLRKFVELEQQLIDQGWVRTQRVL